MIQTFLSGSVTVHVVWAPIGNNPTTPGAKSMHPPLSQVTVPRPDRTTNTSSTSTSVETPTECSQTPTSMSPSVASASTAVVTSPLRFLSGLARV